MLDITNIESEEPDLQICNWVKIDSCFPSQSVYSTDCGATTSTIVGVEYGYKCCPFCTNVIKFK